MHLVNIFNLTSEQVQKASQSATDNSLRSCRCSFLQVARLSSISLALCCRALSGVGVHEALLCHLAPNIRPAEDAQSFPAVQVLTQVEYLAARREGSLVKHADGSWGTSGGDEPELPLSRPLKRARQDISAAAVVATPQAANSRAQQGRRCVIM